MTTTLDLRTAFARHYYAMPDRKRRPQRAFENNVDDLDDVDTTAGEEGKEGSGSGSDNEEDDDQDPSLSPSGQHGDDEEAEADIKNPRLKELSDEAGRRRRENRELRTQVEELKRKLGGKETSEGFEATIRTLRLELAFERMATTSRINDVEAAWRLAADDLKAVDIKNGQVDQKRLGDIVDHVAKRYPYLVDDGSSDENFVSAEAVGTSGRPMNGKRKSDVGLDRGALEARFPALRRMR